jgi:hypothetical protein
MKIRLLHSQADPFLFREGLSLDTIYELDPRRDVQGYGDLAAYFINGKPYGAWRFEKVAETSEWSAQ